MFSTLSEGFLLGLSTAPVCAISCAQVILPVVLSKGDPRAKSSALALGEFLIGRLAAYALVGLFAGWLGATIGGGMPGWASAVSSALLGCALILYSLGFTGQGGALCRLGARWSGSAGFPIALGFLSAASLCPPFVAAMGEALKLGGALRGLAYFLAFFLATSLVLLPIFIASFASALAPVRSLGRVACAVAGFLFLCAAARQVGPIFGANSTVALVSPELQLARELLPAATEVREVSSPVRHFVAGARGRPVGVVVFSSDLAAEVRGFNGHVPVAVGLDREGRISGVRVLPSRETPGYVRDIYAPAFAAQFKGKRFSDALSLGIDVDGVTGATVTSRAVAEAVRLTSRRAAERIYGLQAEAAAGKGSLRLSPALLIAPVLLALAGIAEWRRLRWLRFVIMVASLICLGLWLRSFFSLKHILDVVSLTAPPLRANPGWYVMAALAIGSALLAGRLYCAYICPFGAATDLIGRLTGSPLKVSVIWDGRLRKVKYALLLALPLIFLLSGDEDVLLVEPFADAFTWGFLEAGAGQAIRIAWLVFLVGASLLVFRFFCRYLCPAGAAMAFFARHRLFGRIRPNRCVECGECMISCPRAEKQE